MNPHVALVIVSRDRPDHLARLLLSLRFQTRPPCETVVVTNTPQVANGFPARVIPFALANIPMARNSGVKASSGPILAFIDDDAVPEPTWIERLVAPFADADIGYATGYTRGRNGVCFQWRTISVDNDGWDHDEEAGCRIFAPAGGRALKAHGTNMAVRRDALAGIGGFDPGFAYFLDDADMSLCLSRAGWLGAVVANAEVQHGFAEGPYRHPNRAPKSLREIGRSKALFLRKHSEGSPDPHLRDFFREQRIRLEGFVLSGRLDPFRLAPLLRGLEEGMAQGLCLVPRKVFTNGRRDLDARALPDPLRFSAVKPVTLVGSVFDRRALVREAARISASGRFATIITFEQSARFLRAGFDAASSAWLHHGGVYGRALRSEPILRMATVGARICKELDRIDLIRGKGEVLGAVSRGGRELRDRLPTLSASEACGNEYNFLKFETTNGDMGYASDHEAVRVSR